MPIVLSVLHLTSRLFAANQRIPMKRILATLFLAAGIASAYDHASYNQTGLIIQYDAADNGGDASKLVNLGTAGNAFDLTLAASSGGSIDDGAIIVSGQNSWSMSAQATATAPGGGYTVEFVGEQTGGAAQGNNCVAISLDAGKEYEAVATPIRFSLGTVNTSRYSIQALASAWGSWQNSFSGTGTVAGSVRATRTAVVDSSTRVISYYENGELIGTSNGNVAGTTDNGIRRVCLGDLRRGRGYATWKGRMYSIRIYNRPLSAAEVAENYEVDGYRFYGQVSAAGQLVIANKPSDVGVPTPGSGVHSPATGAMVACSATAPFYKNGIRYMATGYTIETTSDGGETWSEPVAYTGTTYSYVNEGVTTRLTWQWEPTHYRLYVTKNGGSETFAFSPEIAIADSVNTSTAGGYYPTGATVRVTAEAATESVVSTFSKWTGDAGETTANPVTVTMDGVRNIKAWFSRPWLLDTSSNRLTKDEWVLQCEYEKVTVDGVQESARTISGCVSGSGVLDMSELNRDLAAQNVTMLVRKIKSGAFGENRNITGLVLPAQEYGVGIVDIGQGAFYTCTQLAGELDLWSVVTLGPAAFYGCEKLSGNLVMPRCVSLGDRCFRMGNPGKAFKNGRLVAPELQEIAEGAFAACAFTSAYLPKFAPTKVVGNYPFYNAKYLTNIVFSADVKALHPQFVYGGTPESGILVLDFPGNRPTTDISTWMASEKKSQIVIRTPWQFSANWTSDTANFVPKEDVTDTPSDEIRAMKHILGQYGGCWLKEIPPDPSVIFLH